MAGDCHSSVVVRLSFSLPVAELRGERLFDVDLFLKEISRLRLVYVLSPSLSFFFLHVSTYIDNLWGYKKDLTYSQDGLRLWRGSSSSHWFIQVFESIYEGIGKLFHDVDQLA
jgi:hypothetical protein